jgi:GT2 family glycosyltransferase
MGRQPLVSIVLITWNSAPYLQRCLDGIRRQTHSDRELIVVDNASADDSLSIVGEMATTVIRNAANRGFAAAANQGISASRGDYVLLLNPDCFLEPDYCAELVSSLEIAGGKFGSATGKLLLAEDPKRVDSKGIRMTRSGRHLDIAQGEEDVEDGDAEVFGVSGAAAMYRKAFLDDVAIEGQIFDEDFFAYREDADLAWRGRLMGWRAMYVPDAVAHHVRRVTPAARKSLPAVINMHSVKNRFLLRLKNEGMYLALRNAPFEWFRDAVTIGAVMTIERSSLPALGWLWRNRGRIAQKRRAVQSRRRVSDRALAEWFR